MCTQKTIPDTPLPRCVRSGCGRSALFRPVAKRVIVAAVQGILRRSIYLMLIWPSAEKKLYEKVWGERWRAKLVLWAAGCEPWCEHNDRFSTVRACTGVIELRCYISFFINVASCESSPGWVFFSSTPCWEYVSEAMIININKPAISTSTPTDSFVAPPTVLAENPLATRAILKEPYGNRKSKLV